MTVPYKRSRAQMQADFHGARPFEELVGEHLGPFVVARLDSTTELDFWIPGGYIDVKEKRQKLTDRWHLLPGVPEVDLFILDELSLRKALEKGPSAYFVLHDVPGVRFFLARADEVACSEFVRRNRVGKGKLIINLQNFRQLSSLDDIRPQIMADQVSLPWRKSECITNLEIGQI